MSIFSISALLLESPVDKVVSLLFSFVSKRWELLLHMLIAFVLYPLIYFNTYLLVC